MNDIAVWGSLESCSRWQGPIVSPAFTMVSIEYSCQNAGTHTKEGPAMEPQLESGLLLHWECRAFAAWQPEGGNKLESPAVANSVPFYCNRWNAKSAKNGISGGYIPSNVILSPFSEIAFGPELIQNWCTARNGWDRPGVDDHRFTGGIQWVTGPWERCRLLTTVLVAAFPHMTIMLSVPWPYVCAPVEIPHK